MKKFLSLLILTGVMISGIAFAQSNSGGSVEIPNPVPAPEPAKEVLHLRFIAQKGRVAEWNPTSLTLVMNEECRNDQPKSAPTGNVIENAKKCAEPFKVTASPANILIMGPNDHPIPSSMGLKVGSPILAYLRISSREVYALKYMGPINLGSPEPKEKKPQPETSTTTASGQVSLCVIEKIQENGQVKEIRKCMPVPPALRKGMNNEQVKQLQKKLHEKKLLPEDSATGYFGPMTEQALKRLQAQKGLPATGYFGPMTLESLSAE